jgi:hypothetical protein
VWNHPCLSDKSKGFYGFYHIWHLIIKQVMLRRIYLFMVCLLGTGIFSHAQDKPTPPPPPPVKTKKQPPPPAVVDEKPTIPIEVTAYKKAKKIPPPPPLAKTSPGRPHGVPKAPPPPPVKGKVNTPEKPVSQ